MTYVHINSHIQSESQRDRDIERNRDSDIQFGNNGPSVYYSRDVLLKADRDWKRNDQ